MRNFTVGLLLVLAASAVPAAGDATPTGSSYMLVDHWGGTWSDAEKDPNNTEDDLMCWGAMAANVLDWTGWGHVGGMTNADEMFQYYVDHWTDEGGLMKFGFDWWFDGTNDMQGEPGWSQVDVPGGGFYPTEDFFADYYHEYVPDATTMSAIDDSLHAGQGVMITLRRPASGHALTIWGFNYDPADPTNYFGIWATDSDDDKAVSGAPDRLRYFEVEYSAGKWYLHNFHDANDWYIDDVGAVDSVPEPATMGLLVLGGLAVLGRRRR